MEDQELESGFAPCERTAENAWDELKNDSQESRKAKNNSESLLEVHLNYNRLVSGESSVHYLKYFYNKYLRSKEDLAIASFGSGSGFLEPILIDFGYDADSIVGYELNPGLVKHSNENAASKGLNSLRYEVCDLNDPKLPENAFDLGVFFHSLHHVENLERCLEVVSRSIRGDGYLLIVEYVGENYLQWTDAQINAAVSFLGVLPPKYRLLSDQLTYKKIPRRPSLSEVISQDPSESVRSKDILGVLDQFFDKIELTSLGGSILNHVFEDIAHNFEESKKSDLELIRILQDLEQWLERNGYISVDFIFAVYQQKPTKIFLKRGCSFIQSMTGLSQVEDFWCWTELPTVVLTLTEALPDSFVLIINIEGAYRTVVGEVVNVIIGNSVKSFVVTDSRQSAELVFRNTGSVNSITLEISGVSSPLENGESADARKLGLRIESIFIKAIG